MSELGIDVGTPLGDLTYEMTQTSGYQLLAEDLCARWETPQGGYPFAANYGFGIYRWLGRSIDPGNPNDKALWELEQGLVVESLKDERVLSMSVSVTPSYVDGDSRFLKLTIRGKGKTKSGPFTLVAEVSEMTGLKLLEAS